LTQHGPNQITSEKPPSMWAVALQQLRDPMNIMLVAVAVISLVIGEVPTALLVAALVVLNVVLGARQELKARASVDALSKMQVPQTRVLRGGEVLLVPAIDVVPGDVVQVEAGDIVPADGRIIRSATLETQGSGADRRERTDLQAGRRAARGRDRRRRPLQHAVPEHLGDRGTARWCHRDRHGTQMGRSRRC
jgi:Ca2+-transporting ATPase